MQKESSNKHFRLWLLALPACRVSAGLSFVWHGKIMLQFVAVALTLITGFLFGCSMLKSYPGGSSKTQMSVISQLMYLIAASAIYWMASYQFHQTKLERYGFTFFLWSIGIGHIMACIYFTRLQSKGK